MRRISDAMVAGHVADVLPEMMPADTFYLAAEFQRKYPDQPATIGSAILELQELCQQHPEQTNWQRLSRDFGTPHPSMAANYGLELLNVPPMPPFAGNSSRFLAESWDSPNLYWARLADEAGYSPCHAESSCTGVDAAHGAEDFRNGFRGLAGFAKSDARGRRRFSRRQAGFTRKDERC